MKNLEKVIAIKGGSQCGKSSALRLLIAILSREFVIKVCKNIRDGKARDPKKWGKAGDRKAVVVMDDRKVAIYTAGDSGAEVLRAFKWAEEKKCNYLVLAVNTDKYCDKGAQKAFNDELSRLQVPRASVKRLTLAHIGAKIPKGKIQLCIKFLKAVDSVLDALKNL